MITATIGRISFLAAAKSRIGELLAAMFAEDAAQFAVCPLTGRQAYVGREPSEADAREVFGCWKCPKMGRGCWGAHVE